MSGTIDNPAPSAQPPRDDATRRIGVELEFGGLSEDRTAEIVAATLGGTVDRHGPHELHVTGSGIGTLKVYLDTAFRADTSELVETGLELARPVLPVEVVAEPLPPARLDRLEALVAALRAAGAEGSREGLFLGFGLHLNVETTGLEITDLLPVMRAYALIEDHLRASHPIDPSRRLLPFVDPWPRALVDRLAEADIPDIDTLTGVYLELAASRNYGLDALPILAEINPDRIRAALPGEKIAARPAWHFRLPDCLIDDPDWSIGHELSRWRLVEQVAARADTLDRLAQAWDEHRGSLLTIRTDWAPRSRDILAEALGKNAI